jgi:alginate O-acetyltransferase complex protein AlgJ
MTLLSKIKKRADLTLIVGFVLMLSLPAIDSICKSNKTENIDEHRLLAGFPEIGIGTSASSLQNYFRQIENYFNDHFGCRQPLILCHLAIKHILSPTEMGPKVLAGRAGWLYYLAEDMVDNHLGTTRFTIQQLKAWQFFLEKRRDWLAAQGIKYLFVIAPNKESVYPEFLPDWLQNSSGTKLDQFIDYMRLHSTVEILDLRSSLYEARKYDPVYYKTDTHWNLMGAFTADEAITLKVSNQIPNLEFIGRENYQIQRKSGTGGDLARLAGAPNMLDENIYDFIPKKLKLKFQVSGTNLADGNLFGLLPVPEMTFTTVNSQRASNVIVFGDSFAMGLAPFIGYHFGKVTVLEQENFNSKTIRHEKPVLVISEMVERSLYSTDPFSITDNFEMQ